MDLYRAVVLKTRGPEFVHIVDEELSKAEQGKVESRVFESNTLWTPLLEQEFAELYLKRQCLSGIKEELEEKYCPEIDEQHFEHSRLRARGDRIFALATRKINILLDKFGKQSYMVNITDRLKKVISRSPVAS